MAQMVRGFRMVFLLVTASSLVGGACSSKSPTSVNCTGAERCGCYPNKTCDGTLICLSNICVSAGGPGGGGGNIPLPDGGSLDLGSLPDVGGPGGNGASSTGGHSGTGTGGSTGTTGVNLLHNGDFSQGKEYWEATYNAGEVVGESYTGGTYCIANLSDNLYLSFSLGNPPTPSDAVAIEPGASYTLSYTAVGTGSPQISVKIGHAIAPYDTVYVVDDTVTSSNQTYTHNFASSTGDSGAGLVFNGTLYYLSQVCFDDVKLVKN
jgi:hypothetical protein